MVVYGGANATRQRSAPVGSDPIFASSLRPENTSRNGNAIARCCIQIYIIYFHIPVEPHEAVAEVSKI